MEKVKLTAYDAAEFLGTEKLQKGYLDYVAKEGTPEELIEAIKTVARAKGMSKTAKETGISRSGLYKALSPDGNPTIETLIKIAKSIGYNLNMKCPDNFWDDLELFIEYRTALTYMSLLEIDNIGVVDDSNKIKQFFAYIISQDDIMDAMTGAMKNARGLI